MAITTQDGLIAAMAAGVNGGYYKTSITTVAGRTYALFRVAGNPVGGSTPSTSGAALSRTTQGALTIPSPSNTTYLMNWNYAGQQLGCLFLYDRLVETGGLSGNVNTLQSFTSAALPFRNTTGDGAELWVEIYGALGATPSATVTITYTNSASVGSRTATVSGGFVASEAVNTTKRCLLQAGDTGVQSVQSAQLTTATGTVGSWGITIRQPLAFGTANGTSSAATGFNQSYAENNLQVVLDAACVEILALPSATSLGQIFGNIRTGQG